MTEAAALQAMSLLWGLVIVSWTISRRYPND
jgi:hypothetical protein